MNDKKNDNRFKERDTGVERRCLIADDAELRVEGGDDDPKRLLGYAARFNRPSVDLGGFVEEIRPGAFTDAIKDADIRAAKNHNADLLLGRTKSGTLALEQNSRGLKYSVDLPNTTVGRDIVEEVGRGDITGSSFSFRVAPDGDEWVETKDGMLHRTITKFERIYDVGPVTFPAYPDTSVAVRSMEEWRAEHASTPPEKSESDDEPAPPAVEEDKAENEGPPQMEDQVEGDEGPGDANERDVSPDHAGERLAKARESEKQRGRDVLDRDIDRKIGC